MKTTILVLVAVLFVSILGYVVLTDNTIVEDTSSSTATTTQEVIEVSRGAPTFEWSYESFTEDEIPRTIISLTALYSNGECESKKIQTIQGSCNEYVSPDSDVYDGSTMIICYYAGFGHYFKVVETSDGFAVQEKMFEEASPDYSPPVMSYETIATF